MNLKKFNQLFSEYQGRFIRFAQTYVHDVAVAEDFVTEALMYYWERQDSLPDDTNVPAYILVIIKHKCLNHLQHLQVREEVSERMKSYAEWELQTRITTLQACDPNELFTAEAQAIVDRTLATMPKQTREIFIMSRYQNKSYNEIAALTGMTAKGVQFHINKVLKVLRLNLKDYFPLFIYLYSHAS